jgi:putative membrane protein
VSSQNYNKKTSLINETFAQLRRNFIFTVSAFALMAGCTNAYSEKTQQPEILTDANIAAIVVGANNIDISAGKIALERSHKSSVKKFAERMVTDHTAVLNSAVALVTKLGVTPVNNELVATLAEQSNKHEANLRTLSGNAFDISYIDHEVAYHEAGLGVIENQLIPSAQNKELKELLVSVLPAFRAHLEHSQMIQTQIQ